MIGKVHNETQVYLKCWCLIVCMTRSIISLAFSFVCRTKERKVYSQWPGRFV